MAYLKRIIALLIVLALPFDSSAAPFFAALRPAHAVPALFERQAIVPALLDFLHPNSEREKIEEIQELPEWRLSESELFSGSFNWRTAVTASITVAIGAAVLAIIFPDAGIQLQHLGASLTHGAAIFPASTPFIT